MVFSRLEQIKNNYQNKSTGTLSFFMCFLYLGGTLSRILTTLAEVNDMLVLCNFCVAAVINGTLVFQILLYWDNKTKTA